MGARDRLCKGMSSVLIAEGNGFHLSSLFCIICLPETRFPLYGFFYALHAYCIEKGIRIYCIVSGVVSLTGMKNWLFFSLYPDGHCGYVANVWATIRQVEQ